MTNPDASKNKVEITKRKIWIVLIAAIVLVLAVFLGGWYLINKYVPVNDRGAFGDQFGAINALFSGLAFAFVILTIVLQTQELKLQRQELEQTRKELRGQKIQLKEQNTSMTQQRFEDSFYALLRFFRESVNSVQIELRNNTHVGLRAFGQPVKELKGLIDDYEESKGHTRHSTTITKGNWGIITGRSTTWCSW